VRILCFIVTIGTLLSACTVTPHLESKISGQKATATCCKSINEVPPSPMPPRQLSEVVIDEQSPAITVDGGLANVVLLRLETATSPKLVEFQTYKQGLSVLDGTLQTVFVPTLEFFNDSFQPLTSIEPNLYELEDRLKKAEGSVSVYYGVALVPSGTKYIAVYANPAKLQNTKVPSILNRGAGYFFAAIEERKFYRQFTSLELATKHIVPPSYDYRHIQLDRAKTGSILIKLSP